jgi:hypothetical protein
MPKKVLEYLECRKNDTESAASLGELFDSFSFWCKESSKDIVMIIDEVDSASNNQVFLDFLAQLREGYIRRETDEVPAFKSVILAGVTDVRHLRAKIRSDEAHKENSPWNIASDFDIDMSLSAAGIKGMLDEYEADHKTGMNTSEIAGIIHDYTSGYPFLVSRICQLTDEKVSSFMDISEAWTTRGLDEAIKMLLSEKNTLFESITKNLNNYPALKAAIRNILMSGEKISYNANSSDIATMEMYGLIRNYRNSIRVSNRIFETMLYNLFITEEELKNNEFSRECGLARNSFVVDGKLDMRLVLERFTQAYRQICGPLKEKDGREQFLLYLKPIINGTGNYYIEAQTRDQTRTDVIVDYLGRQYIIELKIWHGERYNAEGGKQICDYLDHWNLDTRYMLNFNFNKKKEMGVKRIEIGNKVLFEGMV